MTENKKIRQVLKQAKKSKKHACFYFIDSHCAVVF